MTTLEPSTLERPTTNYRWVVCGLLFFATIINYVDRQILSLLKGTLDTQLHWTNAQYGFANSLFQLSYGISFIGFGWFIDRYGTKVGYAVSVFIWSLAATAHAAVNSVHGFYYARVALGFGEAGNFPSAIKATAQWFPRRERAFATAIFNSAASVGAVAAPLSIPFIADKWGWHSAFLLAGGAGFFWVVAWLVLFEIPQRHKRCSPSELSHIHSDPDDFGGEIAGERKMRYADVLTYPQTWSFVVAKFLTDPVWWFFLIWLPDFFKKTRGLDIRNSAVLLATIYGIITVLSIFGGWLPGYLHRNGMPHTKARKLAMFSFALLVIPIIFVTKVPVWPAVLLIALAGSAHQAWSANLFTTVSDMFPKSAIASVTGLGGLFGSAGGFFFPILTGYLLDHFEKAGNATAGYAILFGICGFAYLLAFVLHHLLAPSFERIDLGVEPRGLDSTP